MLAIGLLTVIYVGIKVFPSVKVYSQIAAVLLISY